MKIRINKIQIYSIIIFLICINISYINLRFNGIDILFFGLRILTIIFLLVYNFFCKNYYSSSFKLITIFFAWLLCVTSFRNLDVLYALKMLSIPYLVVLFLEHFKNSSKVILVLSSWEYILLGLLILDLMSMVLFPYGLYNTQIYSQNWFLGYKTARLEYILPLCIIEAFISVWKYNKLKVKSYFIFFISIICLAYSQATAAFAAMCVVLLILVWANIARNGHIIKKILKLVLDYKILIPVFGILNVLTISIQNSDFIQFIVTQIFNKDATLSTRTVIWERSLDLIEKNWMTGLGFLSGEEYQTMLGSLYYSSPHNMILSILMTGGVIGLVIYLLVIIFSWKGLKENADLLGIISSLGSVCLFIVGITSSSIVYSISGLIFFTLNSVKPIMKDEKSDNTINVR